MVVALFTIGMGFMGTFYSGLKVNNLDLAPNYAGVIMAITNGVGGKLIGHCVVFYKSQSITKFCRDQRNFGAVHCWCPDTECK